MSLQERDEIVRHEDGTIDIRFYARRAAALRHAAKAGLLRRLVALARRGAAALTRAVPSGRGEAQRRLHVVPSDPA